MSESIFDLSVRGNDGVEIPLKSYEGMALLIVNTASKCGFTPQYEGLERLYEEYRGRGLVVLGFPCDQFAHQEPGDDAEIAAFCKLTYGVSFPLTTKVKVNGPGTHPVFTFLKSQGPARGGRTIKWNFTKFLVGRDGKSVSRFEPSTEPDKLRGDIEAAL